MERYINADEFLNLFHAAMESKGLSETDSWFCYRDLERVISATQTADVREVVHGKWLSHYDYCKKHGYIPSELTAFWWCDQCEQGVEHSTDFCPKCGAIMDGDE